VILSPIIDMSGLGSDEGDLVLSDDFGEARVLREKPVSRRIASAPVISQAEMIAGM